MATLLSTALQQFSRSFYSLDNYKLPGDADYTDAFNRCIAAMPNTIPYQTGGGTIMLDGKDYVISSTIVIQKSINIVGVGSDSGTRILLAAGSNCNMLEIGKRNSSDPIRVGLHGMRIQMDGIQGAGFSNVVMYNYIRHSQFTDLFVVDATAPNWVMRIDAGQSPGRNNYFYGCAFEKGIGSSVDIIHDYNLNFNSCYFGFGVTGNNVRGLLINMSANRLVISNSWFLADSLNGNLHVASANYVHIVNNHFDANVSGAAVGSAHMRITSCDHVNIGGNICKEGSYPYAIFGSSNTRVKIYDNNFIGYATQPFFFDDKSHYDCDNNTFVNGTVQDNEGVATINAGVAFVDVTHNIHTTPDNVIATPQANENVWISNIGATTFRINRAVTTNALICSWSAKIKTY